MLPYSTLTKQQLGVEHPTQRARHAHRNTRLFEFPRASSFNMSQYRYSPVPPGANNIRLLRLIRTCKG